MGTIRNFKGLQHRLPCPDNLSPVSRPVGAALWLTAQGLTLGYVLCGFFQSHEDRAGGLRLGEACLYQRQIAAGVKTIPLIDAKDLMFATARKPFWRN